MNNVIILLLSQFQCFFNHDTYSIIDFVNGSVAHEGRGGHQLVFGINMNFFHIFVHVFAAQILQDACCLSIWPPDDRKKRDCQSG